MDADQIKQMNATYDGSVNSEYANIGGNRKETFNIRTNRHYGFRVGGPVAEILCHNPNCRKIVIGSHLVINGAHFHNNCAFN